MKIEKCPFCGGEVSIALCGDGFDAWWFITRGHGENACKCRLFMESEKFNKDSEMADFVADDLIAAWNRRADVVPVVRGEWVEAKSGVMSVWPPGQVMCSVCGQRMPSQWKKMPPYCYGCGAKMESEGST